MDLILRDSARVRLGQETERAPGIARRIVAAMHRHVQRPISLRADSIPAEAVTLVARATEYANQGDTAAAVAALRQVFVVAPRWTVPCVMLRRLQPGEACP
jgi:hypothetical protein